MAINPQSPVKKVLIITYYWPPAGGPGVQRILKFVKYLGEFGWEPIVITPQSGTYASLDSSLLTDVPATVQVFKTKTLEPFLFYNLLQGKKEKIVPTGLIGMQSSTSIFHKISKYIRANFFIPDARVGWNRFALQKAKEIIAQNKIDALITTGPPHSTHLVGLKLKNEFHLPWIADFRDPWTNIYYNKFFPRTKATIKKDEALERQVLTTADCITTVSHGLAEDLQRHAKNISVIYNGYDEDDIYRGSIQKTEKFRLAHIGNFVPFLDSQGLWDALAELHNEIPSFKNDFEINFTGKVDEQILQNIKNKGLGNLLTLNDFVPHKEATKRMFQASLLLFSIARDENNKLIVSGKLFEYIASTTPVISIGPIDGDAATILTEAGREGISDYDDKNKIKGLIRKYYELWKTNANMPFKYPQDNLTKFTRRELTKRLCEELNKLSD